MFQTMFITDTNSSETQNFLNLFQNFWALKIHIMFLYVSFVLMHWKNVYMNYESKYWGASKGCSVDIIDNGEFIVLSFFTTFIDPVENLDVGKHQQWCVSCH